jgi:hypothetical protein
MKFKLGLAIGFVAGYWVGAQADEERKRQIDDTVQKVRTNPRVQRVAETVSRGAERVTDAVESRLVDTADGVAGSAASTAEPGTDSGSSSSRRTG